MERKPIENTRIIQWMVEKRYRLLRHVVLLVGVLMLVLSSNNFSEYPKADRNTLLFFIYAVLILTFYINMNILVPRLFFKNHYVFYFLALLLLVIADLYTIKFFLENIFVRIEGIHYVKKSEDSNLSQSITVIASVVLVTTMIKLFQRWVRDNEKITELNNITMDMEMNGLRNQINPHFLFNMLNGIKALVRTNPEKAIVVIMKLSEFLRYQLYENNQEKTLLKSEMIFLFNFLELEKLRKDNLCVDINPTTDNLSIFNGIFVPPNLFTTFVENAIKHSVNISQSGSYIKIDTKIINKELHFMCTNSVDPQYTPSQKKNSGLGLANIKRRLSLLYGDKHTLTMNSSEREYCINLTIPL